MIQVANTPVRGTSTRKEDLLLVAHLVGGQNDFAAGETDAACVFQNFDHVGTPFRVVGMQLAVQAYISAPVTVCSLDYRTLQGVEHVRS